jgi:hypothetical protein
MAQRRLRALGMLGAIGASHRHIRLVLLANGVVIGGVGALAGAIVGVAGWIALSPQLESALDHRIDRFNLPWTPLLIAVLLATVTAVAAAWWPARAAARIPVIAALSARPAPPRPAHRFAALGAVLLGRAVVGDDRLVERGQQHHQHQRAEDHTHGLLACDRGRSGGFGAHLGSRPTMLATALRSRPLVQRKLVRTRALKPIASPRPCAGPGSNPLRQPPADRAACARPPNAADSSGSWFVSTASTITAVQPGGICAQSMALFTLLARSMLNTPPTQSPGAEAEQHALRATEHTDGRADGPACGGTDADEGVIPLRNALGAVGRTLNQGGAAHLQARQALV